MIRYLPILMLVLGLLLVSTSFAAAQTGETMPGIEREMCVDIADNGAASLDEDWAERCWRQIGLGILVHSCQLVATLPDDCEPLEPRFVRVGTPPDRFTFREGDPPVLDVPPPRA